MQTSHNLPFRCCTAAQDDHIRNFQVVSQTNTHVTFSWDIADGYYTSSYINSFYLYYQHRSSIRGLNIGYSSATRFGATFWYTSSVESFNNGPYVMWVRVYRPSLDPRYTYSGRKYVSIGKYIDYLNYLASWIIKQNTAVEVIVESELFKSGPERREDGPVGHLHMIEP